MTEPTLLTEETILPCLTTAVLGRRIVAYEHARSTQEIAFELARSSETNPDGTLVVAEYQSAGRGRLDRRWISPPYVNLLFSLILCPRQPIARPSLLTFAMGEAVAEAIHDETGLSPSLKWPNDVLLFGRKACGILTESGERPNGKPFWIVGVGVNVNMEEEDFSVALATSATSIRAETGYEVSRPHLLAAILARFEEWYAALQRGESDALLNAVRRRSATLGSHVHLDDDGYEIAGVAIDFDDDGALLVRTELGRIYRVVNPT